MNLSVYNTMVGTPFHILLAFTTNQLAMPYHLSSAIRETSRW